MKPRLLYILAPSYSGSTLLTFLLSKHPDIATVGELKADKDGYDTDYRCSCGELLLECEFWANVAGQAEQELGTFSLQKFGTAFHSESGLNRRVLGATVRSAGLEVLRSAALALHPGVRRERDAILERNFALSRIITSVQGGSVFLDGSKDAIRLQHFLDSDLWDVSVIFQTRDGRGVINSNMKHREISFVTAAEDWRRNIEELQRVRERLPDTMVFDLKYESLCRRPGEALRNIYKWLGVSVDLDDVAQIAKDDKHILGNAMRLKALDEIRLDESWREQLSEAAQSQFAKDFAKTNLSLGYLSV